MTKSEILKVIKAHCLDCCCGQRDEVINCLCTDCNLHPLRFGKDPNPRVLSPEERERRAKIMMANIEKRKNHDDSHGENDGT